MHSSTRFVLLLLGITSQFSCGFSLKPHYSLKDLRHHSTQVQGAGSKSISSPFSSKPLVGRGGSSIAAEVPRGGADGDVTSSPSMANSIASFWAAGGVIMVLAKSIKRILPIALEPFDGVAVPLSQFQLA